MSTPKTRDEWLKVSKEFNDRWGFPHVIGCLDSKHVRISQPYNTGSVYFNYKGYYSTVLLAIFNADYRFLYVDLGAEGRASDGGIWNKCTFNQYLSHPTNPLNIPGPDNIEAVDKEIPYFLVSDEAFRLTPHMMKPFTGGGLTRVQKIFNYRLCRCR